MANPLECFPSGQCGPARPPDNRWGRDLRAAYGPQTDSSIPKCMPAYHPELPDYRADIYKRSAPPYSERGPAVNVPGEGSFRSRTVNGVESISTASADNSLRRDIVFDRNKPDQINQLTITRNGTVHEFTRVGENQFAVQKVVTNGTGQPARTNVGYWNGDVKMSENGLLSRRLSGESEYQLLNAQGRVLSGAERESAAGRKIFERSQSGFLRIPEQSPGRQSAPDVAPAPYPSPYEAPGPSPAMPGRQTGRRDVPPQRQQGPSGKADGLPPQQLAAYDTPAKKGDVPSQRTDPPVAPERRSAVMDKEIADLRKQVAEMEKELAKFRKQTAVPGEIAPTPVVRPPTPVIEPPAPPAVKSEAQLAQEAIKARQAEIGLASQYFAVFAANEVPRLTRALAVDKALHPGAKDGNTDSLLHEEDMNLLRDGDAKAKIENLGTFIFSSRKEAEMEVWKARDGQWEKIRQTASEPADPNHEGKQLLLHEFLTGKHLDGNKYGASELKTDKLMWQIQAAEGLNKVLARPDIDHELASRLIIDALCDTEKVPTEARIKLLESASHMMNDDANPFMVKHAKRTTETAIMRALAASLTNKGDADGAFQRAAIETLVAMNCVESFATIEKVYNGSSGETRQKAEAALEHFMGIAKKK